MSLDTSGAPTAGSPSAEEPENKVAPAAEGSTDANAAASSTADEDGAQPKDLLSVVKDAVKKGEGEAESPTAEGEGEAKPAEGEAKPAEGEEKPAAEADDSKLPFHEHPRWKQVIAERDGYKPDAERFRQVSSFMQTHGLTAEEVGEGFDIMAKLKSGDPENLAEVREYFAKNLALLDGALGKVLPEDLQQRVEAGELDDAAAQELAQLRATDRLRSKQAEGRQQADDEARRRRDAEAVMVASARAVEDWEARIKAADPDYPKKADLVEMTVRAIVQETGKPPRTPEESVKLAEQAYERVNSKLKGMLPKPKPITPTPSGSSATTTSAPKTLKEAIAASLNG